MVSIRLILLILALICFVLSAFGVATKGVNLTAAGLAFWILTLIVT